MGWVALDSGFYKELVRTNRPFTRLEAAFCLTYDLNFNKPWTISGYSKMWSWSRNKTRKFIEEIKSTAGSIKNGSKNLKGHPIRLIGNGSDGHKDTHGNLKGHPKVNDTNGFHVVKDR